MGRSYFGGAFSRASLVLFFSLALGLSVVVPALAAPPRETTSRENARKALQTTGNINVSRTSFSIGEAGPAETFQVSLSQTPTSTVTIGLSRTPTSGVCNISPSSSLELNSTTPVDVTVTPIDDDVDDGNQICNITLAAAVSEDPAFDTVDPEDVTVTVTDDDTAGFSFSPPSMTLSEPSGSAPLTILLTSEPTSPVNITLSAPSDECHVSPTSRQLNSANWDTGVSTTVTVDDDGIVDGDQTCTVGATISTTDGDYGALSFPGYGVTVEDDDTTSVQFSAGDYPFGEGAGTASITVELTSLSTSPVTVDYETSNGTAIAGSDYTATSGMLTIPANSPSATFDVTILQDTLDEGTETVNLTLSNPSGADPGTPMAATLTITDDDPSPSVGFSNLNYSGTEGLGPATITLSLSAVSGRDVSVTASAIAGGTAESGDYTFTSTIVTIPAGASSNTFNVPIVDDTIDEDPETVFLSLSAPTNATITSGAGSATLTITDNDDPPQVFFAANSYTASEADPPETITVELSQTSERTIVVDYVGVDDSATAGSDYQAVSGTLTFPPNTPSQTFQVTLIDDSLDEPLENLTLELVGPPVNATLGSPNSVPFFINDNDAAPTVQFSSQTYSVNEADGSATIEVTLSEASGRLVNVDYATVSGGTATAGSDYATRSGTLSFPAGQTSRTFSVPITDDALDEDDETVNLQLSNALNATLSPPGDTSTLTIIDNEGPTTIQFTPTTYEVNETEGTVTVTVALSAPSGLPVLVDVATVTGGTATPDSDYSTVSDILIFGPGEMSKTFTVPILTDGISEPNETFNLALSNAVNADISPTGGEAVVTIVDGNAPTTVQFSAATYSVGENQISATITVTLSGPSATQVSVDYAAQEGTATLGEDFTMASGTEIFLPGETSQTFTVTLLSDDLDEADETIGLVLSNPVGATLGVPANATLTIVDDDPMPLVSFSAANVTVSESQGVANVTVRLDAASGRTVSVSYNTVDETAVAGSDYVMTSDVLTFAPGQMSQTISVPLIDDDVDEPDETFALLLSTPTNATLGTPQRVTVTILDGDLPLFHYVMPLIFFNYMPDEPNNSCMTAYAIEPSETNLFLPNDQNDWYQFDLDSSGNLAVEVANFVPLRGQIAVYKGDTCGGAIFLANGGDLGTTKFLDLGPRTAGHFYVYVSNDGPLNSTMPYELTIHFP